MKYTYKDVIKLKFNLENLEDYIEEDTGLPIHSFISFYRAIGLEKYIKEYVDTTGKQVAAFDNILCNFQSIDEIKEFIKNQWKIYSIDIDADNHVFWKDDQFGREKHYAKNLSEKAERSLLSDFFSFCPGEDGDLEYGEIVFRTFEKNEEEDDNNEKEEGTI